MISRANGSHRSETPGSFYSDETNRCAQSSTSLDILYTPSKPPRTRPGTHAVVPRARRRIALFTGNYHNVTDGVSRTLHRLVDHLRGRGHQVLVAGPSSPAAPEPNRREREYVAVASLPMPGRPEYRLALGMPGSISRQLEAFAPELVHVATPDLLGLAALNWARSRRVPVVATYHTHFPAYLRFYRLAGLRGPLEHYFRWFYRRCRHVYVPTPPLVDYFSGLGITDSLRLWGRGVDRDAFHPDLRSESWRRQSGIAADDVLVTFVGRLVKEKALDVFASVVAELRGAGVQSMIVGEGPLRRDLQARLPDCLFTGRLEGTDLSRAYASSDVFLFPSDSEAFGNVIVEAMASGLPVVCAASTCSSAHVVHGKTGLVAAPGDVSAFVTHVRRLAECPRERHRMGRLARLRAARYDWERTLDRMVNYYEEIWTSDAIA